MSFFDREAEEPTEATQAAPWGQQPGEPPEAYEAFRSFLEAPPGTTILAHAKAHYLSLGSTRALAARYTWRARRSAFHALLAAEHDTGAREASRDLGVAHARLLGAARALLELSIARALAAGEALTGREAIALLGKIVETERLIAGESTARVEVCDYSSLSTEDLEIMDAIVVKALDPAGVVH